MRRAFSLAIAASLAVLCACQTPEPPPVAYVPPPPPPPPPPLIFLPKEKALASAFIEEAAAFQQAMTAAARISPAFADGNAVAEGLRQGASYEPKQLQRGAVAYVAVLALSVPEFADGFRRYSVDDTARAELVEMLIARPDYAGSFPGAEKAAGLAVRELDLLGGAAWRNGRAVQQAAYDVQAQPWAKEQVTAREIRLEEAKAISTRRLSPMQETAAWLRTIALTEPALEPIASPLPAPYTGLVERGLALAAIAALGEAGDSEDAAVAALLDEPASLDCLATAKLMLFQCLAGSDRGHYEDIFCLGVHAIGDTGQCMVRAANSPAPSYTPPPPPPPPVKPEPKAKAKAKAPPRRPAARNRNG